MTTQQMWFHFRLGPPIYLVQDQGLVYTSKEMKESVEAFGVHLDEAPIESPAVIRNAEECHDSIQLAYNSISAE